MEKVMVIAIW